MAAGGIRSSLLPCALADLSITVCCNGGGHAVAAPSGYSGGNAIPERRLLTAIAPPAAVHSWRIRAARERRDPAKTATGAAESRWPASQFPLQDETKHFKFIGTTGTGKSTAIREILAAALARGDRAVIADPDGGYLRRFYRQDRGDVILNPFDARSVKWDLFAEIEKCL